MKKNESFMGRNDPAQTIGGNLSFAASEAYKRLRTNLLFSFAGTEGCRVIGITSSMQGEGKSTTAVNLAYSLAEAGKHTLLLDADMRLASIHKLLGLHPAPGLSNLLVGVGGETDSFQESGLHPDLIVTAAGDVPPNPTELLSSRPMEMLMNRLKEKFDYIIMDLPPVGIVADALIVSKLTHGMIVVVRQNYADRRALDNTIRQLRFHEANILGFVMNCTEEEDKHYRNKYYNNGEYYSGDTD